MNKNNNNISDNYYNILENALNTRDSACLILDIKHTCLFSNLTYSNNIAIQKKLIDSFEYCINSRKRSFFLTVDNELYSINSEYFEDSTHPYIVFHITLSKTPLISSKYGIRIFTKEDVEEALKDSYFNISNEYLNSTVDSSDNHISANLMIIGEYGTGKDMFAYQTYANSEYCNNPLFVINCSLLNEKNWQFVTNNYQSPFNDNGNTIYLSNINQLPQTRQKKLLSIILDTNMHLRNRLIFSCSFNANETLPHVALEFTNFLNTILTPLNPLRETPNEILQCGEKYVEILNLKYKKFVTGFDKDAISQLITYSFPYNRTQYCRILKQALLKTDKSYITGPTISEILSSEEKYIHNCTCQLPEDSSDFHNKKNTALDLDLSLSLDEINHTIIKHVLSDNDGNQSATARKLGISRTTLWRYLKH